jgi:hypothetical protein
MKRALVILIAAWHLEMAVNAGIAASLRPKPAPHPAPKSAVPVSQCKPGVPCPPSQLKQPIQKPTFPR